MSGRKGMSRSSEQTAPSPYAGSRIALLTQHGKERAIAPVLEPALACRIERVTGYDTDQLGTFTREIPRFGSQLDAARKKARIGMELSGLPLGLASEGSFGPDPLTGMMTWNFELLVFLDDLRQIEVCAQFQGPGGGEHLCTQDWAEVEAFAEQSGFPAQYLVIRPDSEHDPRFRKGVASQADLRAAFAWALELSSTGRVFIEHDLRAHANPGRMENIRRAAEDLAARLVSLCPLCSAPGFAVVDRVAGLPCAACKMPTRVVCADIWGCVRCAHRETRPRPGPVTADPGQCDYCNP